MDLDAFECPICLSLFQGPIFQCKNGHVICDACSVRIHGTCPSCREPVGDIRCRALENIIAGNGMASCSFSSHGCTQLLKLKERRDHEAFLCQHAPIDCPYQSQGCTYSGLLLYDHIHNVHTTANAGSSWWVVCLLLNRPFMVLLDQVDRRVFLLLNGGDVHSGRSLSVVCLGPRPAANELLEYKLKVKAAGKPKLSLSACSVPCMRSWAGQHPSDEFLFVPDAYWTGLIYVDVHVQKSTVNNAGRNLSPCSQKSDSQCPEVDTVME